MELPLNDEDDLQPSNEADPSDVGTFVPVVSRKMTEQETIEKSIQERQQQTEDTVPWPNIGENPINKFTAKIHFVCLSHAATRRSWLAPQQRAIIIGNYLKHMMRYEDGQFAKHPRFCSEHRDEVAYPPNRKDIRQSAHKGCARLTLDELRDMISTEGECSANRVLHFDSSLRGTSLYWFKQRSRLISMVDTSGLPTVFFTHSAAGGQRPELARLISTDDQESSSTRHSAAVIENPCYCRLVFLTPH